MWTAARALVGAEAADLRGVVARCGDLSGLKPPTYGGLWRAVGILVGAEFVGWLRFFTLFVGL